MSDFDLYHSEDHKNHPDYILNKYKSDHEFTLNDVNNIINYYRSYEYDDVADEEIEELLRTIASDTSDEYMIFTICTKIEEVFFTELVQKCTQTNQQIIKGLITQLFLENATYHKEKYIDILNYLIDISDDENKNLIRISCFKGSLGDNAEYFDCYCRVETDDITESNLATAIDSGFIKISLRLLDKLNLPLTLDMYEKLCAKFYLESDLVLELVKIFFQVNTADTSHFVNLIQREHSCDRSTSCLFLLDTGNIVIDENILMLLSKCITGRIILPYVANKYNIYPTEQCLITSIEYGYDSPVETILDLGTKVTDKVLDTLYKYGTSQDVYASSYIPCMIKNGAPITDKLLSVLFRCGDQADPFEYVFKLRPPTQDDFKKFMEISILVEINTGKDGSIDCDDEEIADIKALFDKNDNDSFESKC